MTRRPVVRDTPRTYTMETLREEMDAVEKWLAFDPKFPDVLHSVVYDELLAFAFRVRKIRNG